MAELRLNYEGIDSARQGLLQQLEAFETCHTTMGTLVHGLPNDWSGDTAVSYVQQFDDLAPSFNNIKELISTLAQQLQDITTNFADADSGMSGQLGIK